MVSWVLTLLLLLSTCLGYPLNGSFERSKHVIHALNDITTLSPRRKQQCELNANGGYDCDNKLPSLKEIVDHMRDIDHAGWADPEHHLAFYTLWADNMAERIGDIAKWFKNQKDEHSLLDLKHCAYMVCANVNWLLKQATHIADIDGDDDDERRPTNWPADPISTSTACVSQALSMAAVNFGCFFLVMPKGESWQGNSIWAQFEYWAITRNPRVDRTWRVDPRDPSTLGINENGATTTKRRYSGERKGGHRDTEVTRCQLCNTVASSIMQTTLQVMNMETTFGVDGARFCLLDNLVDTKISPTGHLRFAVVAMLT
ncbi:uncharacterized protein HMPREF1541_09678 [Cyphellophora europaea CBS 101466]|uniref:Uncharacterized protein n=1 Tax=Cyphellophora europaea (strain CBS 101466) TaxID=1220924 RepID=W2S9U3_CYPE1|nr:uncharacterized protein HMPREF1541_09678 [Cyphellophora europaea CBS 101466]ETN44803.1 hypothetical protein HMPREF1541_09678 [Cyphellophora europaea CBS 101466]